MNRDDVLGRLDALENWRTDGTLSIQRTPDGMFASVPVPHEFLAVITGGSNPYSWRELRTIASGATDAKTSEEASAQGGGANDPKDGGTLATIFRPAWERNGDRNVLPGSVVMVRPRFLNTDVATYPEVEYSFVHHEGAIVAQVSNVGAPSGFLAAPMTALATTLTIDDPSDFPGWNGFLVKIGDEVVEVTANAGTATWTVDRAKDGTASAAHSTNDEVTLVGTYSWNEVRADRVESWITRAGGRAGTFNSQPAVERNRNTFVPDGTFVLLWRKSWDGDGISTLNADVTPAATTWPVASRSSFPQTVPFYIRSEGEFVKVTAGQGSGSGSFTVVRGQFGTQAQQHESGRRVVEAVTEWVFDSALRETPAAGSSGVLPDVVTVVTDVRCINNQIFVTKKCIRLPAGAEVLPDACEINTCIQCPAGSPRFWRFTSPAVSDGTCPDCSDTNQQVELSHADGCRWDSTHALNVCGNVKWSLTNSGTFFRLTLGTAIVEYVLDEALWDCMGPNILEYNDDDGSCGGWPANIVVRSA